MSTIQLIIDYYNIYNKLPELNDNDPYIRSLSLYLYTERQKYIFDLLTDDEYNLLCNIPTFENTLIFIKNFKMLNNYYHNYEILPQKFNTSKIAKTLVNFLYEQKEKHEKGTLSISEYKLLCSIPTVSIKLSNSDNTFIAKISFKDKIKYVISYYNDIGKLPTRYNDDKTVKSLGYFLSNEREKNIDKKNLYKYNLLCSIPTYKNRLNKNKDNMVMYKKTVKDIMLFYNTYKVLPNQSNNPSNNKKLGSFLNIQRSYYKNKILSNERYNYLSKFNVIEVYLNS